MDQTLKRYPPSPHNNAREIIRKALIRMKEFPSERQMDKLEFNYGIISDWSDKDYGEPHENNKHQG